MLNHYCNVFFVFQDGPDGVEVVVLDLEVAVVSGLEVVVAIDLAEVVVEVDLDLKITSAMVVDSKAMDSRAMVQAVTMAVQSLFKMEVQGVSSLHGIKAVLQDHSLLYHRPINIRS